MKRSPMNRFGKRALENPIQQAQREALKQSKLGFKNQSAGHVRGRKCYEDSIKFDSEWEREVYRHLKLRQAAGEISGLETHIVVNYQIVREDGAILKQSINIDFQYTDHVLRRAVRLDAKQPKFRINKRTGTKTNLDNKRKDWLLRWEIVKFLQPDYHYEIARQHSGWRDYRECSGSRI